MSPDCAGLTYLPCDVLVRADAGGKYCECALLVGAQAEWLCDGHLGHVSAYSY